MRGVGRIPWKGDTQPGDRDLLWSPLAPGFAVWFKIRSYDEMGIGEFDEFETTSSFEMGYYSDDEDYSYDDDDSGGGFVPFTYWWKS